MPRLIKHISWLYQRYGTHAVADALTTVWQQRLITHWNKK